METSELENVRVAAAIEVERTSIRHVAADIGMSHGALFNFVARRGQRVYGKTARKLREWYVRKVIESGNLTTDAARTVIDELLWGIPPQYRVEARKLVVRALVTLRARFGGTSPKWLNELSTAQGD
jgi:hypothetical protein